MQTLTQALARIARTPKVLDRRRRLLLIVMHLAGLVLLRPVDFIFRIMRCRPKPLGARRRILLMRIDGVGDMIMTTALFPSLRRAFPESRIDLLCSTLAEPLARAFLETADLNCVYSVPLKRVGFTTLRRLIVQLRANRYDVAVDLRGDFRNVLIAWLTGARYRYGLAYSGFDYLLTQSLSMDPIGRVHQVEEVAALGCLLGAEVPLHPKMPLPIDARVFADQWLATHGAHPDRPVVAFHLGAGMPARIWPLERFIDVARDLQARYGSETVVLGAASDRSKAELFVRSLDRPALVAAGEVSLVQSAALLARASLFIGTDSGPAHLASSVGCPLVVLFGPGNSDVMRPCAPGIRIVRARHPCDPRCHNVVCAVPDRHCLKTITSADVCAAADELLECRSLPRRSGS